MFERLVQVSLELSEILDAIEQTAQKDLGERGFRHRQAVTVIERVRIARAKVGDELAMLMREVQAVEVR